MVPATSISNNGVQFGQEKSDASKSVSPGHFVSSMMHRSSLRYRNCRSFSWSTARIERRIVRKKKNQPTNPSPISLLFIILISNLAGLNAQSCETASFRNNAIYRTCVSLPVLNSHLHWNYNTNGTVDLAFRHTGSATSQWVAWALNVGGSVEAYTTLVTGFQTTLQPSRLSFDVAERVNGVVVIYATIVLPSGEDELAGIID
ncbi:hypothetical protein LXL04_011670 [Taraxacum kok-saghyz]